MDLFRTVSEAYLSFNSRKCVCVRSECFENFHFNQHHIVLNCIYLKILWDLQAVEESLKSVNLYNGGVADKQAGHYSGGMKRRLSVAISLIGDPKVSP